jgi:hypothetical protein
MLSQQMSAAAPKAAVAATFAKVCFPNDVCFIPVAPSAAI